MSNVIHCDQGSAKWFAARLGRPTASHYSDIVTPKGAATNNAARERYLWELVGERITGQPTPHFENDAMRRGSNLEPQARAWYTMQTGRAVAEVGFVYALDGRTGASPDGLVGEDGAIEIKCLLLHNHLAAISTETLCPAHYMQAQGVMWAADRQWLDFIHYTDALNVPSRIMRVERDHALDAAFSEHLAVFIEHLDAREAELRKRYDIPAIEPPDIESASGDWCPFANAHADGSAVADMLRRDVGRDG